MYDLPRSVEVGGVEYQIRTDYRCILDICGIFSDPELSEPEKAQGALEIFYFSPGVEDMPPAYYQEAINKCCWFINNGEEPDGQPSPKLVDWEQDFKLITAPVSRVYGEDVRDIPYDPETNQGGLHWWTFLSYYMEIGDCLFAQVVRLRDRRRQGKPLDKQDREFYRRNRKLIDFQTRYTSAEEELLREWGAF